MKQKIANLLSKKHKDFQIVALAVISTLFLGLYLHEHFAKVRLQSVINSVFEEDNLERLVEKRHLMNTIKQTYQCYE